MKEIIGLIEESSKLSSFELLCSIIMKTPKNATKIAIVSHLPIFSPNITNPKKAIHSGIKLAISDENITGKF